MRLFVVFGWFSITFDIICSRTTPPSPPISLIPPTITLSLEVIDESGSLLSSINLGDKFKLRVSAIIDVDAGTTYTSEFNKLIIIRCHCLSVDNIML